LENLNGREDSEDLGVDATILEWVLWKYDGKDWIGCICFRIGISDVIL
jgi:hypothetical protein